MIYDIVHLPKEKWQGTLLPVGYQTCEHYEVSIALSSGGMRVDFVRTPFAAPVSHMPEDYNYPDKLYSPYWQDACAWGVLEDGKLMAAIETCPEKWSNRLRVTEMWVDASIRRRGVARALMAIAKQQARIERRRALMLETQSCNTDAIDFYTSEGFSLIGFDACAYTNRDIARGEVRMELGILYGGKPRLTDAELTICEEGREHEHAAEAVTRRAFWNLHRPGCDEHLLVRKLRADSAYLPDLSRVALVNGEVVGAIYYSEARVVGAEGETSVLTFGPLSVDPDWQGRGVGEKLLTHTIAAARAAGWGSIIIYGEPEYYPRVGFKPCDRFGITTPDGKNFAAFMALELRDGALDSVRGAFHEADVFRDLPQHELDDIEAQFPPMRKIYLPSQWR